MDINVMTAVLKDFVGDMDSHIAQRVTPSGHTIRLPVANPKVEPVEEPAPDFDERLHKLLHGEK